MRRVVGTRSRAHTTTATTATTTTTNTPPNKTHLPSRSAASSQNPNPFAQAPLYQFSFSSVSNILSSVCQYEALKFVSFPTQVLAKSCKMVPVMLMGFVVNQQRYSFLEYIVAIMITAGAAIFKLNEANDAPVKNTELVRKSDLRVLCDRVGRKRFTRICPPALCTSVRIPRSTLVHPTGAHMRPPMPSISSYTLHSYLLA